MTYRFFFLSSIVLSLVFSLPLGAKEKKKEAPINAVPIYQALSPYKAKKPKPAKALTSLTKKQQTILQRLINQLKKQPDNIKMREKLAHLLHKLEMHELFIRYALPYNDQLSKYTLLFLANSLNKRFKYKEENKILKSLAMKDPKNHLIQYKLGTNYYNLRQANSAVAVFRQATELNPKFYPPYFSLLSLFEETKNSYEQRQILKIIIKNFGGKADLYAKLCHLNHLEGFIQEGLKDCTKAYKMNKKDGKSLTLYGLLSLSQGDVKNGERAIHLAANKFKNNEFSQWAAGKIYFDKKNYHVAKRYYTQALQADQTQARSHLGLAQTLYEMKNYKLALASFNQACRLDQAATNDTFRVAANKLRQSRNYDWMDTYNQSSKKCRFVDLKIINLK